VVVQMIRGHVEEDRHGGMERYAPLELEAAHLDYCPVVLLGAAGVADEGGADVSADKDSPAALPQDVADERRGRGLPVGAGDGDEGRAEKASREFQLAEDRDARLRRRGKDGIRRRHAGGGNDEVYPRKNLRIVRGGLHPRQRRGGQGLGIHVRSRHFCPPAEEKLRRGQPRFGQPDDGDVLSLQFHNCAYLNFRVLRATRARRMEMIQKRTMTFGSAQPFSSK